VTIGRTLLPQHDDREHTMRALIRGKDGGVRFDDVAEPVPGPGELLVEVDAFSINRGETMLLDLDRA
jgi:NADPH2:quinone reductase